MVLAVGREASGVAFGDSMMGIGRVTGWLTPFRYEKDRGKAARLTATQSLRLRCDADAGQN
jgi:hypothetical protein